MLIVLQGANQTHGVTDNDIFAAFEKYFDEKRNKWRQVTVTLKSKSRVAQSEAKNRLARKIEQSKKVPTANELQKQIVQNKTVEEIYEFALFY